MSRIATVKEQIDVYWESLDVDVKQWLKKAGGPDTPLGHHIDQFLRYARQVTKCLFIAKDYEREMPIWQWTDRDTGWKSELDFIDFKALVVATLWSQWDWLHKVVCQTHPESPYTDELGHYQKTVSAYYHRLRQALPKDIRQQISPTAPLACFGHVPAFFRFKRNAPGILSIPFGARMHDERFGPVHPFADTIPHEISHAVFDLLPGFLPELTSHLTSVFAKQLAEAKWSRKKTLLNKMALSMLREIVAELTASALPTESVERFRAFIKNSIWLSSTTGDKAGLGDRPVTLVPYLRVSAARYYMLVMSHTEPCTGSYTLNEGDMKELDAEIDRRLGDLLERRFEPVPALTVLTLKELRDELQHNVIPLILDAKLPSLNSTTLGEILYRCACSPPAGSDERFEWGEISRNECQAFVLDLPASKYAHSMAPETAVSYWCSTPPYCNYHPCGGC